MCIWVSSLRISKDTAVTVAGPSRPLQWRESQKEESERFQSSCPAVTMVEGNSSSLRRHCGAAVVSARCRSDHVGFAATLRGEDA